MTAPTLADRVPTWGELAYRAARVLNWWGLSVGRRFAAWGVRRWRREDYAKNGAKRMFVREQARIRAANRRAMGLPPIGMTFNLATWQLEPLPARRGVVCNQPCGGLALLCAAEGCQRV